jgi:RNA polymerase subunit RPABC4/transcription elongation factor Spt4
VVIPIAVLFILIYITIISKTYICPKCGTEFKPKWYQIYITVHFNDTRLAKCPNCKRKGFCKKKD